MKVVARVDGGASHVLLLDASVLNVSFIIIQGHVHIVTGGKTVRPG